MEFCSDLEERKDEANGEVGQPVQATPHGVGSGPVGLFEELCRDE